METETRACDETATIIVSGEVDVATSPDLKRDIQAVIRAGAIRVTIDLAGVSHLDSSGLGVLVGAHKRLRAVDGTLRVIMPKHPQARRQFELTGLHRALSCQAEAA